MINVLICSSCAPYDNVPHAGGKIHNFYLKQLKLNDDFNIHLISFASSLDEQKEIDLDKYHISNTIIFNKAKFVSFREKLTRKIIKKIYDFFSITEQCGLSDVYRKYSLYKELMSLKKNKYIPDIVELNWTDMVLYFPMIFKIFPKSKYCAVEQDVSFLRIEREYKAERFFLNFCLKKIRYKYIKKKEISVLSKFDIVFTFTQKDKNLLKGLNNVEVINPYFQKTSVVANNNRKNIILFYGNMSRKENYLAAIWFIENVFLHLTDMNLNFVILGANPNQILYDYQNQNILITGYQEDISKWFQKALCLVAPLELGAGIKIKILETLAAGVPVLCSDVASEGIDITDTVEYFRCISTTDYVTKIKLLHNEPNVGLTISANARSFIDKTFDLEKSALFYAEKFRSLVI
jgi:glycosyltransferase involved in cell wall biosynthesis